MKRRDFLAASLLAPLATGGPATSGTAVRDTPLVGPPFSNRSRAQSDPYALVLGTAQDAGVPQVGCYTERCERGREAHLRGEGRYVASLALVEPERESFYLVDATPDITRQTDLIVEPSFRARAAVRRPFDGIFLTHAHIGHYLGLAHLGNEGMGVSEVPVYCTASMARFLDTNEPWSHMIGQGRIVPTALDTEVWHRIDDWLEVKLWQVPHRDEFSDTAAFLFRGPSATLLYLPDIDSWTAWSSWDGVRRDVAEAVTEADVALLDASFWSADELPGRAVEDIPHPLVLDSMDRLQAVVDSGAAQVVFTHLNNSNPALDEDGPEQAEIVRRGFATAREGDRFPL